MHKSDKSSILLSRLAHIQINIRSFTNRSIRTTLAILLCKLRLGLLNTLLTVLYPTTKQASRVANSEMSKLY